MNPRITLKNALMASRENWALKRKAAEHIPSTELYKLLLKSLDKIEKEHILRHLLKCNLCARELKVMIESVEAVREWDIALWDIGLRYAAKSEIRWPKKIPTEGGIYTIVIRRSLSQKNSGVVTVEVASQYRGTLEGKMVILKDGNKNVILKGQIIEGEVSQQIEELDKIRPPFRVEVVKNKDSLGL